MASLRKVGNVWRVQVARRGVRLSGTFPTKAAASLWAAEKETAILKGSWRGAGSRTVEDLFNQYAKRVSAGKAGMKWEQARLNAFARDYPELAAKPLDAVTSNDFGEWRDARLAKVSQATVIREMNLYSHAFTTARDEWKWIAESPLSGVRRPKEPKPRDRRISDGEYERLMFALGYECGKTPETASARVGLVFQFAIETGMRAGEICGLTWDRIFLDKKYLHLDRTKNGFARDVPLSGRARAILEEVAPLRERFRTVDRATARPVEPAFGLNGASLDALFRKAKDRCGIDDLHFHDTRHEAITRLAKKLDVLDLARMVGIRDLKILMVYYNETATQMAEALG